MAGFNFRSTAAFVTDGAGETYVDSNLSVYPTTRGGYTFGWVGITNEVAGENKNAGIDRRLAGINYIAAGNGTAETFRVDLAHAGIYTVDLAIGAADGSGTGTETVVIKDGDTTLFTVAGVDATGADFTDAQGNTYSAANWPTSEQPSGHLSFSGTILDMQVSGTAFWVIAHLAITEIVSGGAIVFNLQIG